MSTTPPNPSTPKKWWQSNTYRGIGMIILTAFVQYAQQHSWIPAELQGMVSQLIQQYGDQVAAILVAVGIRSSAAGTGNAGAPIIKSLV